MNCFMKHLNEIEKVVQNNDLINRLMKTVDSMTNVVCKFT